MARRATARMRLGLLLALGSVVLPGWAALGPAVTLTPWRFLRPTLVVPVDIPVGTVLASVQVVPGGGLPCGQARWRARLQVPGGRPARAAVAQTNLTGLGVRMMLTGAAPVPDARGCGGVWVELVKTGVMQPGAVRTVMPDVDYRLLRSGAGGGEALTTRLHYAGVLTVVLRGGERDLSRQQLAWHDPHPHSPA